MTSGDHRTPETSGKKLLFIGFNYHGYTSALVGEFERLGYSVTYYDIEPWTLSDKITHLLSPSVYQSLKNKRHKAIVDKVRCVKYDVVLFLQSHQFSDENLHQLREDHGDARFILYNWDSLKTISRLGGDCRRHLAYFDCASTFDKADAEALGIGYLPLFCIREFQNRTTARPEKKHVYFVGNLENARRYEAVRAFAAYCGANEITFSRYLACRPRVFVEHLMKGRVPAGVSFGQISRQQFGNMLDVSSAVFDFANHDQTGFTMRVMENLCAGKKIITNNKHIIGAPFYDPKRILVYEGLDFAGVKEFLEQDLPDASDAFERYYIQGFARSLLVER